MVNLIALYKQPTDPAVFDAAYLVTHLPLHAKVPGLQKTVLTHFSRTLMGEGFYLMAEMFFADADSLKSGLRSPEMAPAGENLNMFSEGLVSLLIGEAEQ